VKNADHKCKVKEKKHQKSPYPSTQQKG